MGFQGGCIFHRTQLNDALIESWPPKQQMSHRLFTQCQTANKKTHREGSGQGKSYTYGTAFYPRTYAETCLELPSKPTDEP